MSNGPEKDLDLRMIELRSRFAEGLEGKLFAIRALWTAFAAAQGTEESSRELLQIVHRLAGSAGTFGFWELGDFARSLEALLQELVLVPEVPNRGQIAQVEKLLRCLQEAVSGEPTPLPRALSEAGDDDPWILIADSDAAAAAALAEQLANFGYDARVCSSPRELHAAVRASRPLVGLIDLDLGGDSFGGVLSAIGINAALTAPIPWFFLSRRDDLEARLRAIHAGARAYFLRPVSLPDLLKALDEEIKADRAEPYRILVVEDDVAMARFATTVLEQAGLEVRFIAEPRVFLDTVSDFKPELILMDLYLDNTLGTELAQVLEQHDGYQNLPVVFLSAEVDERARFEALDKGGDNFLSKPINPLFLVQAVRSRVRRARQVGTLVFSDSLTGLMNHRAIMSRMAVEVKRSLREDREISLAVLDIDLFKPINDTHGHAVGDRVLQALGRMLSQRLRESDLVGRYGGEEFVVLLPNTGTEQARLVIDEIRERFSRVLHNAPSGQQFNVTFSGGIAGRPPHADLQSLFEAADGALYLAKASGRNRTFLEDPQAQAVERK